LSVIPAAQLEHIDWLAAESSDAPSTGQGIIFNLLPLGLRPPDEAGVMDTLFEGIGQNVYQNVLSPAEQTEWQTLDSATSPTQAQLDFVSLYDFWLPESDKAFEGNLNEALVGPNPNSLFFQEVLFFVATLFVNPDKTMNFYRTNAVVSPVAVTVTAVTVTRTTTGFSLPAVGSALPATQYTLSGDGTTITSVTWVSQTYAVDIPIPQPFVTYLDSLPISGP